MTLEIECFGGAGAQSLLCAPFRAEGNPNDSFDGIVYNYQYELNQNGSYKIIDRYEGLIFMKMNCGNVYIFFKELQSKVIYKNAVRRIR
ncbi:MAG: hypothetical protein WA102_09060 [Candidatus Methanoperedens sp.]